MEEITRWDIDTWLDAVQRTYENVCNNTYTVEELKNRLMDSIYMITLIESLMTLEEPQGVLKKAHKRQEDLRNGRF